MCCGGQESVPTMQQSSWTSRPLLKANLLVPYLDDLARLTELPGNLRVIMEFPEQSGLASQQREVLLNIGQGPIYSSTDGQLYLRLWRNKGFAPSYLYLFLLTVGSQLLGQLMVVWKVFNSRLAKNSLS